MLAAVLRWRHSLFWSIVPAMFVTSCAAAAILVISATIQEDTRLRHALSPSALVDAIRLVLPGATALTTKSGAPSDVCGDTLHVVVEGILAETMGDRTGDANANGFHRATQAGRIGALLVAADGSTCRFPSAGIILRPELERQLQALARQESGARQDAMTDTGDGWISAAVATIAPGSSARLVVGLHVLSPWTKLLQQRSITGALALFILSINALSALVLVLLLIRRIKRADAAAAAWTLGALSTRIDDRGRDEFSRLTRKFDMMADAMSNMIVVKQALAAAEERNRVARDLHDSVKQRAFALNLRLSIARELASPDSDSARQIDAALVLTSQLQQDLSNIIRQLAAPTIAESGLRNVLDEGVEAMLSGGGISYSLTLSDRDERLLDTLPDVAHQLSLITIEAVSNALQHSRCTHCAISGEQTGETYVWRIIDNGAGLTPNGDGAAGMGLSNMKLRATTLPGGTFDILAAPGGGTAIVVSFTVKPAQPL